MSKLSLPEIKFNQVKDNWLTYDDSAKSYFANMAVDIDYYHGNQLSALQVGYLAEKNLPTSNPTNIIKQMADSVVAGVAAQSPELAATIAPETSFNTEPARVYSAIFKDISHKSRLDVQFREQTADFVRKGLGITTIFPVMHPEPGLIIERLEPESIRVPSKTKRADFQDAESIIRREYLTRNHAKTIFPEYQTEIDEAQAEEELDNKNEGYSNTVSSQGVRDGRPLERSLDPETIAFYWNYTKISVKIYRVVDITGRKLAPMAKDMADRVLASLKAKGIEGVSVEQGWAIRVRETFFIGDKQASDNILPINKYPYGVACNNHSGNPYSPSDIRYVRGAQDKLNRTVGIIMESAENAIGGKVILERGAFDEEAVANLTLPKVPVVANDGAISGGIDGKNKRYDFIPQGAMMAALFEERNRDTQEIMNNFAAYGAGLGDPTSIPETASGAMILEENVSRNQKYKVRPLYDSMEVIGDVGLQWIPFVYSAQQVFQITDEERIVINRPQFDAAQNRVVILNDMQSMAGSVRAVVDSARAKNFAVEMQIGQMLVQSGLLPRSEFIRVDLPPKYDKKAAMLELNEISSLQSQVQAMGAELKRSNGDLQTAQRGQVNAEVGAAIDKATKRIEIAADKAVNQIQQ